MKINSLLMTLFKNVTILAVSCLFLLSISTSALGSDFYEQPTKPGNQNLQDSQSSEYQFKIGDIFESLEDSNNKKYRIIDFLGYGGYGEVYLIQDIETKSEIALKLLRTTTPKSYNFKSPYLMPISVKRVRLPNGTEDLVEVMPKAERSTLLLEMADTMGIKSQLNIAYNLMTDIQKAIVDLSRAGYVHNDIKSSNILFYNNRYVLSDYDTLTEKGVLRTKISGSDVFMSPEAHSGKITNLYSDYYSLGITLAEAFNSDFIQTQVGKGINATAREDAYRMLQTLDTSELTMEERRKFQQVVMFIDAALRKDPRERMVAIASYFQTYPNRQEANVNFYKSVQMKEGVNKGKTLDTSKLRGIVNITTPQFVHDMDLEKYGYIGNVQYRGKFYIARVERDSLSSVDFIYEKFKDMAGGHADLVYQFKKGSAMELLYEIVDVENSRGYALKELSKPIKMSEIVFSAEAVIPYGEKSGLVEGGLAGKFGIVYRLVSVADRFLEPVIREQRKTTAVDLPFDTERVEKSFWNLVSEYSKIGMATQYNLATNNCITSAIRGLSFGLSTQDRAYVQRELEHSSRELNRLTQENFTDQEIRRILLRYASLLGVMQTEIQFISIQNKPYFHNWFGKKSYQIGNNLCQGLFF